MVAHKPSTVSALTSAGLTPALRRSLSTQSNITNCASSRKASKLWSRGILCNPVATLRFNLSGLIHADQRTPNLCFVDPRPLQLCLADQRRNPLLLHTRRPHLLLADERLTPSSSRGQEITTCSSCRPKNPISVLQTRGHPVFFTQTREHPTFFLRTRGHPMCVLQTRYKAMFFLQTRRPHFLLADQRPTPIFYSPETFLMQIRHTCPAFLLQTRDSSQGLLNNCDAPGPTPAISPTPT